MLLACAILDAARRIEVFQFCKNLHVWKQAVELEPRRIADQHFRTSHDSPARSSFAPIHYIREASCAQQNARRLPPIFATLAITLTASRFAEHGPSFAVSKNSRKRQKRGTPHLPKAQKIASASSVKAIGLRASRADAGGQNARPLAFAWIRIGSAAMRHA